jgi:dienelactone hydrolase
LFRPLLAEQVALSPDGERLAYTRVTGRNHAIVIVNLDAPGTKRTVAADPQRATAGAQGLPPAPLRFLRWATATRLVYAPAERILAGPERDSADAASGLDGPMIVSPIRAVDADGRQQGTLVDARDFQETAAEARSLADLLRTPRELQATRPEAARWRLPHLDLLGFLPRDREQLVIGTRGAFSPPAQHLVDIRTGSVREFGGEWPAPPGEPQVFDWFRLKVVGERRPAMHPRIEWRDEELAQVQRELEAKFPRRVVEIVDWSETRARVLARVSGGSDAGRLFLYQRPENLVVEILRRAPWLAAARWQETRFFEFVAADGAPLSGYLTWPGRSSAPPPLLVVFPAGFPGGGHPAFDPEAQAFAAAGFLVARLNHRSVAGVRTEDLARLRTAVDRVAVADARAAIEWIAARHPARPFDRERIAVLGRGFGGYLAVRALQLEPAVFRGGVALDAPMDLQSWLRPPAAAGLSPAEAARRDLPPGLVDHAEADWRGLSAVAQAEALTHPVLFLTEPRRDRAVDTSGAELRARLQQLGRAGDFQELEPGFAAAEPRVRASVHRRIESFLQECLARGRDRRGEAQEAR